MEGGAEWRGCVHRIRNCVLELVTMEDDVRINDGGADVAGDDDAAWELVGSTLRLKSTFLYCDLNRLLSVAGEDGYGGGGERKKLLSAVAGEVLCHLDQLGNAVRRRSISETKNQFKDAADALKELMAVLEPPSL